MRRVKTPQLHFGEVNIAEIEFDARSRDDIPAVLKGLQYIYTHDDARKKVFSTLAATLDPSVSTEVGRPGMELWEIFVLATLKLGLNCDFDRLQELANNHNTVRKMLGHSGWEDTATYKLQTIIDNVSKLKPSVLADINQVIVESGHEVEKKKPGETLRTRCDSLVVETDVHYPTDISLLWDAMRKVIELTGKSCESENLSDWRQHRFNLKQLKKRYRKAQKIKHSTSKDEAKKAARSEAVHQSYRNYLRMCRYFAKNYLASMPKIHSLTRQLIPFAPTVLRPLRFRTTLFTTFSRCTQHSYHNDSTATKAAPAFLRRSLPLTTTKGQTAWPIGD